MNYMKKFLLKDNCKALYDIGDDAPSIFFEIWYDHLNSKECVFRLVSEVGSGCTATRYTSANSDIRVRGKETARVLLEKLVAYQLEKVGDKVPDHDDFFG
jgi:hypothetical protein